MPEFMQQANWAVILLCAAFAAPAVTVLVGVRRPALTGIVAMVTMGICFAIVLLSYGADPSSVDVWWAETYGLRFHLELDGLAQMFSLLATGIGLAVVIYAYKYIPLHLHHYHRSLQEQPRFFGYLLLFMAAMVGLVMSADMMLQFLFWDLTAIASFFQIGRNSTLAANRVIGEVIAGAPF